MRPFEYLRSAFGSNKPEKIRARESAPAEDFQSRSKEALAKPFFQERHDAIVDAATQELGRSMDTVTNGLPMNSDPVLSDPALVADVVNLLKEAISEASLEFKPVFETPTGYAHGTPEAADQYNAALKPKRPNRKYAMKLMALLNPSYKYDLAHNAEHRRFVSQRVDETLNKVSICTLRDIAMKELGLTESQLAPLPTSQDELEEHVYGRLGEIIKDTDYFKKDIVGGRKIPVSSVRLDSFSPRDAAFVSFALMGPNGTWMAAQVHRDKWAGMKPDRVTRENYRSFAEYAKLTFNRLRSEGMSIDDALLVVTYELEKDRRQLAQDDVPAADRLTELDAQSFAESEDSPVSPMQKDNERTASKRKVSRGALATAALAASVGAPVLMSEKEDVSPEDASQVEPLAAEHSFEIAGPSEARGDGAIRLFEKLKANPEFISRYDNVFPGQGMETNARAHEMARVFGLWRPGSENENEIIGARDTFSFDSSRGLIWHRTSGREELLMTPDGTRFPYAGDTIPERKRR